MPITSPPTPDSHDDAKDIEFAKGAIETTTSDKSESVRLGESEGGAWATGGAIESYKPIAEYEGAHRWDPSFQWAESEEKRLVRRVSYHSILGVATLSWDFPPYPPSLWLTLEANSTGTNLA